MTMIPDTELVLVVAADENNVIGLDGGVPWHYPEDVRQYKNRIAGHPIILGRRTSIDEADPGLLHRRPDERRQAERRSGDVGRPRRRSRSKQPLAPARAGRSLATALAQTAHHQSPTSSAARRCTTCSSRSPAGFSSAVSHGQRGLRVAHSFRAIRVDSRQRPPTGSMWPSSTFGVAATARHL